MFDNSPSNPGVGATTLDGISPCIAHVRPAAAARWALLLALLLALAERAQADDGVLIEHVPDGADNSQVLAVVRQALVLRHWTIEKVGDTSVTAAISRAAQSAHIRVFVSGDSLLYEGSARELKPAPGAGGPNKTMEDTSIRERWIANLRSEIAMALAVIPNDATPKKTDGDSSSVAERLKVLEELRASGLISQDEYEQKRAAILSSL